VHCWFLSEARLGSWDVTPLLDNRLFDWSWVDAGPGADFLGDVNALLSGLELRHQLGNVLALLLGLQVAGLLWHLNDNRLLLGVALLSALSQLAARWTANLHWNLSAFSYWGVLLDRHFFRTADLLGPLGTLLRGGVTLGHILALLLIYSSAIRNIIHNIMLVVVGGALRLIFSPTYRLPWAVTDEGSSAELNLLLGGHLLVINKAFLDKVLLALLLLLGLEVSAVGGVALLAVAVMASNFIIVLGLLNHHNLVDTPLTGSGNGSNVQLNIGLLTSSLTSITGGDRLSSMVVIMVMVMVMVVIISMGMVMVMVMAGSTGIAPGSSVEGEGSPQVLTLPFGISSIGAGCCQHEQTQTFETVHDPMSS